MCRRERSELSRVLYCAAHAGDEDEFEGAMSPIGGDDEDGDDSEAEDVDTVIGDVKKIGIDDVIDVRTDTGCVLTTCMLLQAPI